MQNYPDKYYKSMDKAILMFNDSDTEEDYIKAGNYFYRISQRRKCRKSKTHLIGKNDSRNSKAVVQSPRMKTQLFATFTSSIFNVKYHGFVLVFWKNGVELVSSKI